MKKRFFAFSVAIMAFLAISLRANAAYNSTSGKIGGCGVSGYVYIYDSSATAITSCECNYPYCTVGVTYHYADETDGIMKAIPASSEAPSSSVSATASRAGTDQGHVCRSYKATSTHSVTLGSQTWNSGTISVYYP